MGTAHFTLGGAIKHMEASDARARAKGPPVTREGTRAAADALGKARDRARSAGRQAQEGAVADEPIRIPGADEYRAPERFREDLLEAMKKKGQQGPDGYDAQITITRGSVIPLGSPAVNLVLLNNHQGYGRSIASQVLPIANWPFIIIPPDYLLTGDTIDATERTASASSTRWSMTRRHSHAPWRSASALLPAPMKITPSHSMK